MGEESPGSIGQKCRVTLGGGDSKDSATEINHHLPVGVAAFGNPHHEMDKDGKGGKVG